MNQLPLEVENIIFDYKQSIENYEKAMYVLRKITITNDIFTKNLQNNGYSRQFNYIVNQIYKKCNIKLTHQEIFDNLNFDETLFNWDNIGSGYDNYARIEDLPRNFVEQFKDKIRWFPVGDGQDEYTKIENLPRDFVEQFIDEIQWFSVGDGQKGYTKIEDLPRDFIEQFKHRIYWMKVGTGDDNYTKIEDLPRDFVEQFKDKINWSEVGSGNYNYTKKEDLPRDFVKQFNDKISNKTLNNDLSDYEDNFNLESYPQYIRDKGDKLFEYLKTQPEDLQENLEKLFLNIGNNSQLKSYMRMKIIYNFLNNLNKN